MYPGVMYLYLRSYYMWTAKRLGRTWNPSDNTQSLEPRMSNLPHILHCSINFPLPLRPSYDSLTDAVDGRLARTQGVGDA